MRRLGLIGSAALLCVCFGTGIIAIQTGVRYMTPLAFTTVRLAIVVAALAILLAVTHRRIRRDSRLLGSIALIGLLGVAFPYTVSAFGLQLISSTLHSILSNLIPVFSVVLAHFFVRGERLTVRTAGGVLVAVVGASIVVWGGAGAIGGAESNQALVLGVASVVVVSLSLAVSSILTQTRLSQEDGLSVTAGQMVVALALVAPVALLSEAPPDLAAVPWQGWAAVLWAALIGGVLGFLVLFHMLRRWGVTTTAVGSTAVPLVTAAIGVSLLGETLTIPMVIGGLVLVGGVLIVLLGARRRGR